MSRHAPIRIPPTRADVAVARACLRSATPAKERALRTATWMADEKMVFAGAALLWLCTRHGRRDGALAQDANHILACAAVATALPHVLKHVFSRERPDRTVARGRRLRGVRRSGDAWDSFPSGHAVQLGAVVQPLARLAPAALRPLVWPAALALASTRVMLLAHYVSDVVAGFGLGLAVERTLRRSLSRRRRS